MTFNYTNKSIIFRRIKLKQSTVEDTPKLFRASTHKGKTILLQIMVNESISQVLNLEDGETLELLEEFKEVFMES